MSTQARAVDGRDVRRLRSFLAVVILVAIAGTAATYVRYRSLDPCDWMAQDLTAYFDLPAAVVQAKIRADFLLQGVVEPGPQDCLLEWWRLRREGTLTPS